ncbi:MAG TPA: ABC transporter ATP-binding protein [Nevskiaceae bacterium]
MSAESVANKDRSDGAPVLQAIKLQKYFGGLKVTDNLSLALRVGRIHALIGPNGAGKTTALAQLSGELSPDAGRITLRGRDITRLSMPRRAKAGVIRSFQITAIFNDFTVLENVCTAVQSRSRHHFSLIRAAARDHRLLDPARQMLTRVGLERLADRRASELAHGQKRQLEIAMALSAEPIVLLLDEPMAGMGPKEVATIADLLDQLRIDHAILLVEHDMNVVFRLADEVTVLVNGAVLTHGSPMEIRGNRQVQAAYLEEHYA